MKQEKRNIPSWPLSASATARAWFAGLPAVRDVCWIWMSGFRFGWLEWPIEFVVGFCADCWFVLLVRIWWRLDRDLWGLRVVSCCDELFSGFDTWNRVSGNRRWIGRLAGCACSLVLLMLFWLQFLFWTFRPFFCVLRLDVVVVLSKLWCFGLQVFGLWTSGLKQFGLCWWFMVWFVLLLCRFFLLRLCVIAVFGLAIGLWICRWKLASSCVFCAWVYIVPDFDLGFVLKERKKWLWIGTNCCVADEAWSYLGLNRLPWPVSFWFLDLYLIKK